MKLCTEKYYKDIINRVKKINLILEILEMSYEGNIGLTEMVKFFQIANPQQVKQFEELMSQNNLPEAWNLVQQVVGVKLHGLK